MRGISTRLCVLTQTHGQRSFGKTPRITLVMKKMNPDKIITALFLFLLAGAMLSCHVSQGLRVEGARLEESRLDAMGVVGWVWFDPEKMQLVFVRR